MLTATLPFAVAKLIAERLGLELVIVGKDDIGEDDGLKLREENRKVSISVLELKNKEKEIANNSIGSHSMTS